LGFFKEARANPLLVKALTSLGFIAKALSKYEIDSFYFPGHNGKTLPGQTEEDAPLIEG
jgi:hypothetical protein